MEYSELKKRHFGNNDTEKKLTDEEIKSSLEVIATTRNCNECKIRNCKWGTCNCSQITANAALDLINRQKEEIEALYQINTNVDFDDFISNLLKEMVGERRMTDNQEAEKALKKLK